MSILRMIILFAVATSVDHRGWQILGPGGGGAQFNPTVSPHDPNRVLVSCDMTGAYLSEDGGASWRMFNFGSTVRFFAFDESRPRVVYAQTNRLWRSEDGGRSWKVIYPADAKVEIDGDHGDERALSTRPAIDALAADGDNLWAGMGTTLQRSTDFGKSWVQVDSIAGRARRIVRQSGKTYVLGSEFVAIHEQNGTRSFPHRSFADISVGFDEGRPYFYGASAEGVFLSSDGEQWKKDLPGNIRAIAACQRRGRTAYTSLRDPTGFGVARTSDGGRTWEPVWHESRTVSPKVDDGWVSARFGPGWGEHPLALAVSPGDPERAWGTDLGRTLRTIDGGKTWTAAYTKRLEDGSFTSTGLDVTTNYGVHFDPFEPARMFISYTDIGLFISENRGKSWRSATTNGVPREWVNTTYWVEFDPDVRGRMWAVMSGTHDLPRPKMWRRTSPERYRGGVCRSLDGGRTWNPMTDGMPPTAATHILLDRRSPESARVLYVAGFGRGVFRSDNGGLSWSLKNKGLPEVEPFAWRLTQDRDGTLYVVLARRSEDGSIGNGLDGALYRSSDRAETWEKVTLPEGVNGPNGLTVDPQDPRRLYLAAWARRGDRNGGIFLSIDKGATWKRVHDGDQHVYDVTIDPKKPGVLYACGFESAAWRSADRSATWKKVPGYDFKWGHRVVPDPADSSRIYVTTYGGSVWHGPAQ